ncbi:MAG TPA: UpxY family transcription antiterminator [Chryseosolibacter sp.]
MQQHWFVFYTKSRQEKKVSEVLQKRGFKTFLPLHKVLRQWSDRKKRVEVPLFNSYIFVFDFEHKIPDILQVPGIAWNIKIAGRPAVLRAQDIEIIQRFLATGFTMEADTLDHVTLKSGQRAKIMDGPLKGIEGVIIQAADAETFVIALEGIDQLIRVQIPAFLLKKL